MKNNIFKIMSIFLLILATFVHVRAEGGDKKGNDVLFKPGGAPSYTHFNVNNISTWIKNDGETDINPNGNSGLVFPKGSNKAAVFQSGFVWGGKIDGEIRVGGSTYRQGLRPGRILGSGANIEREDESLPHVRIYRVRKDYLTGNLLAEVNDGDGATEDEVRAQYEQDWQEWPADFGAPFEDVDSNGTYNPDIDIPGVPGADQTIWFVANDLDVDQAEFLYGSKPMNLEMQATIWGYASAGALGNMLFRKYSIINKGDKPIEEMYVSWWSDPDVGDAGDDYVGCDTTLSMSFAYNGETSDGTYGENPPAVGFDFFQGPMVQGEPGDTAIFNFEKVPGMKNLPMTAHYFFINGDDVYVDPELGEYATGTLQFWNLFRGRVSATGEPFKDPDGNVTKFTLAGDPVTQSGWVDGIIHAPGDRRCGMVSGTFTMNPGDTQEIVVAEIAAGAAPGINNIQAIQLLKTYDQVAQDAYDDLFVLPSAPTAPDLKVSALDNEVVLNWGWNQERVAETEAHSIKGFTFQGYNVYQLPSRSAPKSEAVRVATFDIVDGNKVILGDVVDPGSGATVKEPQQFGNDTGIKRSLSLTRDHIKNEQFINGIKYYFAVTAYAYNPDPLAVPNNLENPLGIVTITPQSPDPGVRYEGATGDTLFTEHAGPSDGSAFALVAAPDQLTGHDYKVTFEELETFVTNTGDTLHNQVVWHLDDVTANKRVLENKLNQTGDDAAPIADGLQVKVMGPPLGTKQVHEIDQDGVEVDDGVSILEVSLGSTGYLLSNREGVVNAPPYARDWDRFGYWGMDDIQINFAEESLTWDYISEEVHFTADGNPYKAPFSVYRTKFPSGEKQRLFAGFWDVDGDGTWNISVDEDGNPNFEGPVYHAPSYEAIYCWVGYDADGNDIDYDPANDAQYAADNALSVSANTTWGGGTGEFHYPYITAMLFTMYLDGSTPPYGNIVEFITNKPNTDQDEFTFTAPSVTESEEIAKEDVDEINVFPNPYYGYNPQELNKYQRFVTFNHLPDQAKITIVNLAGQVVRIMDKEDESQFMRWDLANENGLPVASGLYLAYIDMPDLGETKVLKLAIVQEEQVLDRF